jgi:hypothetical protein
MRDGVQTAIETNAKYNSLRDEQRTYKKGKVTLLPNDTQPALAPLEEKTRYIDPQTAAEPPVIDARQPKPDQPAPESKTAPPPSTEPPVPSPVPKPTPPPTQ